MIQSKKKIIIHINQLFICIKNIFRSDRERKEADYKYKQQQKELYFNQLRAEKEEKEMEECTFHPQINQSTSSSVCPDEVSDRLYRV